MPVGILKLQPKTIAPNQHLVSVSIDGVEVAAASNADLVLLAVNSFGQTETTNVIYNSFTTNGENVNFAPLNLQVSGKQDITLTTKLIKKSSNVFVKEVSLVSNSLHQIALNNKVAGNALSYYNFKSPDSPSVPPFTNLTWGSSGTQHYDYMQAVGFKVNGSNVLVLSADDGWSSRWNIGTTNANAQITKIETNELSINYGFSNNGNTIVLQPGTPLILRFIYSLAATEAYNFRKDIQINWAIAKDCPYNDDFRRILWTTARINLRTANTTLAGQIAFIQPSWYWSVAQWMRDSFWTSLGINDADLAYRLFSVMRDYSINWNTGMVCGALLDTLTIWGISIDDSILHFISWAYWLKKKYNIDALTINQLNSVVANVTNNLRQFNRFRTARGYPGTDTFAISFHDAMGNGNNYNETAYNQGWCCVALRAAKELGANVTDDDLAKAIGAYRSFYKQAEGYINTATFDGVDVNRLDSPALMGEAFYNWWFNESILGSEIVSNQWKALQRGKVMDGFKCLSLPDGSYIFSGLGTSAGATGTYQNGGIWLWLDFCCFFTAMYHHLDTVDSLVAQWNTRVNREFAVIPAVSEALDTLGTDSRNQWGLGASYNPFYGWNAGILAMLDTFLSNTPPPDPPAPPPVLVKSQAVNFKSDNFTVPVNVSSTGAVRLSTLQGIVSINVDENSPVRIMLEDGTVIGLKQ